MDAIKLDGNEFSEHYERMVRYGVTPKNARHTVGRKILTVNTLILDEDGLYDPSDFNDRLLLGMKGTISEAELHILRARLQGLLP